MKYWQLTMNTNYRKQTPSVCYGATSQKPRALYAAVYLGIKPGKCFDDEYIRDVFDIDVTHTNDKGQREACACVDSRAIDVYDTCILGCKYCYATSSFEKALINFQERDKMTPSLLRGIEDPEHPNTWQPSSIN